MIPTTPIPTKIVSVICYPGDIFTNIYSQPSWWLQSILKDICQNGSFPQIGLRAKNIWNQNLATSFQQKISPPRRSTQTNAWSLAILFGQVTILQITWEVHLSRWDPTEPPAWAGTDRTVTSWLWENLVFIGDKKLIPGHYITNPNTAQLRGNPKNYHIFALVDPTQKWVI